MPNWQFRLLQRAQSYLERLPAHERARIYAALDQLKNDPQNCPLKRLHGRPEWRLRVGDQRVLLQIDRPAKLFIVTRIGPRGDIYKR